MTTDWLWTLPLVGAALGWATNWLAVRMLFRPRRPVGIFGLKFLGLIPRRRKEIASKVAAAVERELITPKDLQAILSDEGLLTAIEIELDGHVAEFLESKLEDVNPLVRMMVTSDFKARLRRSIVKHAMAAIPDVAARVEDELEKRLDIRKIVEERMNAFDIERLEGIVLDIARGELRAIEVWGAMIGAAVGGAQWALLHFLG